MTETVLEHVFPDSGVRIYRVHHVGGSYYYRSDDTDCIYRCRLDAFNGTNPHVVGSIYTSGKTSK